MARIGLTAENRDCSRKSVTKSLRKSGFVPGIVYHKGENSVPVQVSSKELLAVLHTEAGRNVLIDLKLKDDKAKKQRTVVVKELLHDPVGGGILHVDFHQISLTEKITVHVPIVEKGESPGVKNDGGVLETLLREINVECLPTDIPEHVEIDIGKLQINDSIHVRDLVLPESVKLLSDPDMVIVQVKVPVVEKPEEPAEAATEPEVIGEKKEEGEEEAGKAEEGKKEKPQAEKTPEPGKK